MSGVLLVRQSGPTLARTVTEILLAQGSGFDSNPDILLNSAHRLGNGSDHADVASNNAHRADVLTNPHAVTAAQVGLPERSDIYLNRYSLWAASDGFRKLETTETPGPFYVGLTGYGDSMANVNSYTLAVLTRSLQMRYGCGGLFTPNLGQTWLGAALVFTGGAAQGVADYTYFPGSNQVIMPAGSTAEATTGVLRQSSAVRNDGAFPFAYSQEEALERTLKFKTVRCLYLKRPGDGTLTFTVSQAGVTGYAPIPVSCDAALALSFVDIAVIDPTLPVTLHAGASGAECIYVGAVFLRESGVLAWSSQVGGSTMEQQKTYIDNGNVSGVYTQLCQALSTSLFIHAQRVPGDANWEANYTQVFSALAAVPATAQLILGEPPVVGGSVPTVAEINEFLYSASLSDGYAFIDQNKALGSNAGILTSLGWGNDDVAHLDAPAHRFLSAKILSLVDWFRVGGNQIDASPLTLHQLVRDRLEIDAPRVGQSYTITGRVGNTMEGITTSGGFGTALSNIKGFSFTGAASLGYSSARPGVIPAYVSLPTPKIDLLVGFTGYRNLKLPTGNRGFGLVGVSTTFTSLTTLNQRCFGFEVARGSDVGSPQGVTDEVVRLLASDGAAITYGPWVRVAPAGVVVANQSGFNITILWDKDRETLALFRYSLGTFNRVSELSAPDLATLNCGGAYVNIALVAEDAGNVPVAASDMSFLAIKANWRGDEYGVPNNGMITNF